MSWEDQGRQEHGWFGNGTAPKTLADAAGTGGIFGPNDLAQRSQAVAYGALGALPQALRSRLAAQYDAGNLARLTEVMTAWSRGTKLGDEEFANRFFGRTADDPVAEKLHNAALDLGLATNHADLREAAEKLADAIQAIGLDRWPRFLADAQDRARDPTTVAAIERSRQPPDPGRDAIQPAYPIEAAIGVAAAGIAGGAVAAARAASGAMFRQVLPESGPPVTGPSTAATASKNDMTDASAASVRDKLARYTLNPEHPVGGSKAKWFEQALGFTRQNSEDLARQLVFDETSAVQTAVTKYGTKFEQTINVVGANGRTIPVSTAWIKGEDGVAKLVTAFPGK